MPGAAGATFTVSTGLVCPKTVAATRTAWRATKRDGARTLICPAADDVANRGGDPVLAEVAPPTSSIRMMASPEVGEGRSTVDAG